MHHFVLNGLLYSEQKNHCKGYYKMYLISDGNTRHAQPNIEVQHGSKTSATVIYKFQRPDNLADE